MNKKYFYALIIGILVLSNIIMLAFIINGGKDINYADKPKMMVIKKLHFNKEQIVEYEEIIEKHQAEIKAEDKKINHLKQELYHLLLTDNSEQKRDSLTTEIGLIHAEIETIHYNHFQDIKGICRQDQMERFDKLAKQLQRIFKTHISPENQPK